MIMSPGLRRFVLTAHITASVGWLGAVVAYLSIVVAALEKQDVQTVRAAWTSMEFIGRFVIVPLAFASLITGLFTSLGTAWGLFRHYWVLFKLLLTVFAIIVLLQTMPTVSFMAHSSEIREGAVLIGLSGQLLHAGGGLLVLLVTTTLSVFKPKGMTPYGRRKQSERRNATTP